MCLFMDIWNARDREPVQSCPALDVFIMVWSNMMWTQIQSISKNFMLGYYVNHLHSWTGKVTKKLISLLTESQK